MPRKQTCDYSAELAPPDALLALPVPVALIENAAQTFFQYYLQKMYCVYFCTSIIPIFVFVRELVT